MIIVIRFCLRLRNYPVMAYFSDNRQDNRFLLKSMNLGVDLDQTDEQFFYPINATFFCVCGRRSSLGHHCSGNAEKHQAKKLEADFPFDVRDPSVCIWFARIYVKVRTHFTLNILISSL